MLSSTKKERVLFTDYVQSMSREDRGSEVLTPTTLTRDGSCDDRVHCLFSSLLPLSV